MFYIRPDLFKAKEAPKSSSKQKDENKKPVKVSGGKGEQRGGKYVARVQVGYRTDGSPKYRYFISEEEYEKYLEGKGRPKAAKELEHKVKKEHEKSTDKHSGLTQHTPASKKPGLLETDRSVNKSFRLYVRI